MRLPVPPKTTPTYRRLATETAEHKPFRAAFAQFPYRRAKWGITRFLREVVTWGATVDLPIQRACERFLRR
jgi:hypothetical protein